MAKRFTLVGPNEGRTVRLGKYEFVNGVHIFEGSDQDALLLARVITPYYSAYPDEQLEHARASYAALLAGERPEQKEAPSEEEDAAAEAEAEAVKAKAAAEAEAARAAAEKDAAEAKAAEAAKAAAADQPKTLAEVVQSLDHTKDEHWTGQGLPAMEAVEKLFGKAVTRKEVDEAAPGYNRAAAKSNSALD